MRDWRYDAGLAVRMGKCVTGRLDFVAPGISLAILSAVLFGASTPFAKLLLGNGINPWLLASRLYLGSGLGLPLVHIGRKAIGGNPAEASLARADCPGSRW